MRGKLPGINPFKECTGGLFFVYREATPVRTRPPLPPSDREYTPARSADKHLPEAHWRNPSILSPAVTATGMTKLRPSLREACWRRSVRVGWSGRWWVGLWTGSWCAGRCRGRWRLLLPSVRAISLKVECKARPSRLVVAQAWKIPLAGDGFRALGSPISHRGDHGAACYHVPDSGGENPG